MKLAVAAVSSYVAAALIFFGDIFAPIASLTLWPDRLGIPLWRTISIGCCILSALVFFVPQRWLSYAPAKAALFVALAMSTSTAVVGVCSDQIRHQRILAFRPDELIDHSFFRSIREAPREFQFYLHSAALKDCVPYAWSYRPMSFYKLPPNVAKNVLPNSWLISCAVKKAASDGRPPVR